MIAEERAKDIFRPIIVAGLGPSARARLDAEGWPLVPGKYGRLEWRGIEADTSRRVYAYTDRVKMISKLRTISGVHPLQVGDQEAAFWIGG